MKTASIHMWINKIEYLYPYFHTGCASTFSNRTFCEPNQKFDTSPSLCDPCGKSKLNRTYTYPLLSAQNFGNILLFQTNWTHRNLSKFPMVRKFVKKSMHIRKGNVLHQCIKTSKHQFYWVSGQCFEIKTMWLCVYVNVTPCHTLSFQKTFWINIL